MASDHDFLSSTFYEQLTEHVFISELLQEAWFRFGKRVEVLRPEIDAAGFDLVLECDGILRHVQLKASRVGARTSRQKLNIALESRVGGCVIWIVRVLDEEKHRISLRYRYFGGEVGEPLPALAPFAVARHAKANAQGFKKERPAIRSVPKGSFQELEDMGALLERLFGLREPAEGEASK
jgi:hypothetical protein